MAGIPNRENQIIVVMEEARTVHRISLIREKIPPTYGYNTNYYEKKFYLEKDKSPPVT